MANYTFSQLEGLWIQAGGSRALAPLMAGVGIVESGGNPGAYNPSGASGLWQIEMPLHSSIVHGNVFSPTVNARAAVLLSGNTLGGIASNWLAFEPAGAAQAIANQHGGAVPSIPPSSGGAAPGPGGASPGSSGGTGGTASGAASQNLFGVLSGMFPFVNLFGTTIQNVTSTAGAIEDFASVMGEIGSLLGQFMRGVEILFTPTFWVRAMAFVFGVPAAVGGLIILAKANHGGTTAIGMLQIFVAAILLFVAFHNIPPTVTNPGTLAQWIKDELQGSVSTTAQTAPAPYTAGSSLMAAPLAPTTPLTGTAPKGSAANP